MPKINRTGVEREWKDLKFTIAPLTLGDDLEIQDRSVTIKNRSELVKKTAEVKRLKAAHMDEEAAKVEAETENLIEAKPGSIRFHRVYRSLREWNFTDENDKPLQINEANLRSIPSDYFGAIEEAVNELNKVPDEDEQKN